jgi:hypothetical protein
MHNYFQQKKKKSPDFHVFQYESIPIFRFDCTLISSSYCMELLLAFYVCYTSTVDSLISYKPQPTLVEIIVTFWG